MLLTPVIGSVIVGLHRPHRQGNMPDSFYQTGPRTVEISRHAVGMRRASVSPSCEADVMALAALCRLCRRFDVNA